MAGLGRLWRVLAGETEWHMGSFCAFHVGGAANRHESTGRDGGGWRWVRFALGESMGRFGTVWNTGTRARRVGGNGVGVFVHSKKSGSIGNGRGGMPCRRLRAWWDRFAETARSVGAVGSFCNTRMGWCAVVRGVEKMGTQGPYGDQPGRRRVRTHRLSLMPSCV